MKTEAPASQEGRSSRDFQVRLAEPHEERAARMLLSRDMNGALPQLLYVAVTGRPSRVVGAAGLTSSAQGTPKGLKIGLRVVEPFRRRGIGRGLLQAGIDEAKARHVQALYAQASVAIGSREVADWAHMGFNGCLTENHYEADPHRMVETFEPLCGKMRQCGWVPADAKVVSLKDAPAKPVADLHVRFLGGTPQGILGRIRGAGKNAFHPTASQVLMLGSGVGGILLCRRPGPTISVIEAVIVVPELRLGWANALLKLHAAQNAVRDRIVKLCFTAHETHPDTRQMAASAGAKLIRTAVVPYRLL